MNNSNISKEIKEKKLSEEHKRKIGESIRRWHKEIGFSEETRRRLSEINKGRIRSESSKRKVSEANKGKIAWNKGLTKEDPRVRKSIEKSSATQRKLYKEGKLKSWNLGKHHTEETKRKISLKRKGKTYEEIMGIKKALQFKKRLSELGRRLTGKNNPMYGKVGEKNPHFGVPAKHGKYSFRKDLGHNCRSKWEANYARYLLFKGKRYSYEPKRFIIILPNGTKMTYTPDFLVDGKEWYELKGWEDRSEIKKWKLFRQQYPDEKFVLIDHNTYKNLERIYKYIIPNWEH